MKVFDLLDEIREHDELRHDNPCLKSLERHVQHVIQNDDVTLISKAVMYRLMGNDVLEHNAREWDKYKEIVGNVPKQWRKHK